MATPYVLEMLANLKTRVATNETNIAKNAADIKKNRQDFDTHAADDTRHWTTADRNNFTRVIHFKGYYATEAALKEAVPTGAVGDYAIVGETDTVWVWDDTSKSWLNSTEQGIVISVNGRTGEVVLSKNDVGLGNVDNTADAKKPISEAQQAALNLKANKGVITAAEVDGVAKAAGIYLFNASKTIDNVTAEKWTVIIGDTGAATGMTGVTQIWIPNNIAIASAAIFYRIITTGTTWSEFRKLATSVDISGLQSQITTNKNNITSNDNDITALQKNKADRIKKTVATDMDAHNLRAGIYNLESTTDVTILGYTNKHWTVIIGEFSDATSVTQIWMPYTYADNVVPKMFMRRAKSATAWSDFVQLITSKDVTTQQLTNINHFKGYYATAAELAAAVPTGTAGDYAIVGETETIYIWNTTQKAWTSVINDQSIGDGAVTSVNGMTGVVTLTKSNIGLGNVDNTADKDKNVKSAGILTTARKIDGVAFNGSADIIHYGACSTAGGTAQKDVPCAGFSLVTGARITVKFTNANTVANPTLNVNSSGAKAIQNGGVAVSVNTIAANSTYDFVYDGTAYQLIGGKTQEGDITVITKSLTVTTAWMDTGIKGADLTTGAYVVRMSGDWVAANTGNLYSEQWVGLMSWYQATTNNQGSDEILLHNSGHAENNQELYLRTLHTNGSDGGLMKLQIAAQIAFTAAQTIKFQFRKLI